MTYAATLGGITFDGTTADADDLVWCIDIIEGWHNTTPIASSRSELPYGETLTRVHERARPLLLRGSVKLDGSRPLRSQWFVAERALKEAMRFEYIPGLLVVSEPDSPGLELQAYVRRADQEIRNRRIGKLGMLQFEVPLVALDPRRYDSTLETFTLLQLTASGTTITDTALNEGDRPTSPIITIDEPATNPVVTNNEDGKFVRWVGTLGGGDTLVIDMAAQTVEVNAVSSRANLDTDSRFWSLLPGTNSLTYARTAGTGTSTAQLEYRHAYS